MLLTGALMADLLVVGRSLRVRADPVTLLTLPSCVSDGLSVLSQSLEDTGLTLVWSKPDNYSEISDYAVCENGTEIGGANRNGNLPTQKFFDRFLPMPPTGTP